MSWFVKRCKNTVSLWGFPLVYIGWAWGFWSLVIISDKSVWTFPNTIFLLLGGLSPVIAGLFFMWLTQGKEGYRDFLSRLIEIRRIRINWLIFILLFYPVFNFFVGGLAQWAGISETPIEIIKVDTLLSPLSVLLLVAFALIFPLVEEIGLRGYWLDRLQERMSGLSASLVLGIVWGVWHLPLFLMDGYFENANFDPQLHTFILNIILASIIYTTVYNNNHRSVISIIILHFIRISQVR